jgi:hypothetical protein
VLVPFYDALRRFGVRDEVGAAGRFADAQGYFHRIIQKQAGSAPSFLPLVGRQLADEERRELTGEVFGIFTKAAAAQHELLLIWDFERTGCQREVRDEFSALFGNEKVGDAQMKALEGQGVGLEILVEFIAAGGEGGEERLMLRREDGEIDLVRRVFSLRRCTP